MSDVDKKYQEWEEKYMPVETSPNHIMFETHGNDEEIISAVPNKYVWTVVDGEGSKIYAIPGRHIVNRLNYILCRKPWTDKNEEVQL